MPLMPNLCPAMSSLEYTVAARSPRPDTSAVCTFTVIPAGTFFCSSVRACASVFDHCFRASELDLSWPTSMVNVFTIEVGQDKSSSDARKQWSKTEAQARTLLQKKVPAGITVNVQTADVSGLGDRAATVYSKDDIAGHKFGISGIYLLKGATFVAFQDLLLGDSPPSTSALQAQARTTLSRVP